MDLAREIERFDPEVAIESGSAPPASWYVEPDFLALEAGAVFRRSWLCAGRSEQVDGAGAFVAGRSLGVEHLVVRDERGGLRAFHNVCRHHAARLVDGAGSCDRLVCPYHGWTYGLDGALKNAPRVGGIRDFDRDAFGLQPIAVVERAPLVFVHADAGALDDLPDLASLDTTGLRFVETREYRMRCNWKVYVDNYLDGGYHVPVLHAALGGQLDLESYRTEVFARHSVQSCGGGASGDGGTAGGGGGDFAERIGGGAQYVWIYPNLMLNRYGPMLDTNLVVPLGVDETLVVFDYWFDADVAGDARFVARALAASDRVQQEDAAICESVQRGLASGAYDRGRYAPRVEVGEHHFHRLLAADLRAGVDAG